MKRSLIFLLSFLGLLVAGYSAWRFSLPRPVQPPAFAPAANPFAQGIYALGMVEADQDSGSNTNLFFEVPGTVRRILVKEGDRVRKGAPLAELDERVQAALAAQQASATEAARQQLASLRAQPRPENLAIAEAQLEVAEAGQRLAQSQYDKLRQAADINPGAVSRDALDTARNSLGMAAANRTLAERQLALSRAGAWHYDIAAEEAQLRALEQAAAAAQALLDKFVLRAPQDGTVLAINMAAGGMVGSQGSYDAYTGGWLPPLVMAGGHTDSLAVRCFVDEILLQRLPPGGQIRAEMSLRGSSRRIPLSFVRIQPYVSPKIELSNQRQERVDVRVLPVILRFPLSAAPRVFPGQQVDVYLTAQP